MKKNISVIVPVWNREKLIIRCLNSIINQSLSPFEIIVVDNDSTDGTYKEVENWINKNESKNIPIKLLKEPLRGAYKARQRGLEESTGNYLIFFDSDDEMHQDLIENVVKKLDKESDVDIVCWKCRIKLLDGSYKTPLFEPENPIENHLIHTLLRPQGYVVKKNYFQNIGAWSKPLEVWDDYELGLRLLMGNPKIVSLNKVLAEIYSQEASITGKDFSSKLGKWEHTLNEMLKETIFSNSQYKYSIIKILLYRKVILAAHYYKEGNKKAAKNLYLRTLQEAKFKDKLLLKFAFYYTSKGLRGVWRIIRKLKYI